MSHRRPRSMGSARPTFQESGKMPKLVKKTNTANSTAMAPAAIGARGVTARSR